LRSQPHLHLVLKKKIFAKKNRENFFLGIGPPKKHKKTKGMSKRTKGKQRDYVSEASAEYDEKVATRSKPPKKEPVEDREESKQTSNRTKKSKKGTNKLVKEEEPPVEEPNVQVREEAVKREEVKKEKQQEEAIVTVLANAGMPQKMINDLAPQATALDDAIGGWNSGSKKVTAEELQMIKAAVSAKSFVMDPSTREVPKHAKSDSSILGRIERSVVGALSNGNPGNLSQDEREQIDDLLDSYSLKIGKARHLQLKCNFREVPVQGHKSLSTDELKGFLAHHPTNHLAIYSVERDSNMYCYYVVDLYHLSKANPGKTIKVGDVVFTDQEATEMVQWKDAFDRLQELIKNATDQTIAKLKRISDFIAPTPVRGTAWKLLSRAGKAVKRQIERVWNLIAAQFLVDIVACVACVSVFVYATSSAVGAGVVAAASTAYYWPAIKSYIIGALAQQVFAMFAKMETSARSTWFGYIMSAALSAMAHIGLAIFSGLLKVCVSFFDAVIKTERGASIMSAFASLSEMSSHAVEVVKQNAGSVAAGLNVAGVALAAGSGAVAVAGVVASTPIWVTMGFALLMYQGASAAKENFDAFNPKSVRFEDKTKGVGPLLNMLADGKLCTLVDEMFGNKSMRLCKYLASSVVGSGLTLEITRAVIDLLVFLVRLTHPSFARDYYEDTKCERMFVAFKDSQFTKLR